jgi:hypothetical protein
MIFAAALLLAGLVTHPGVVRWPIKTSIHEMPATPVPLPILSALPQIPGVAKDDARYQSALIPGKFASLREGETISTEGWLRLVASETDGDYHVQLTLTPTATQCLIVEVPRPSYVKAAKLKAECLAARSIIRAMIGGAVPSQLGTLATGKRVRITGQLFYDDAHVGTPPRGKRGMKAMSLWELHPVTLAESIP